MKNVSVDTHAGPSKNNPITPYIHPSGIVTAFLGRTPTARNSPSRTHATFLFFRRFFPPILLMQRFHVAHSTLR